MSGRLEVSCEDCGTPTTFQREEFGPRPLPCSCCGDPVVGDTRLTVGGVGATVVVCPSCAHRCRRCRPLRGEP